MKIKKPNSLWSSVFGVLRTQEGSIRTISQIHIQVKTPCHQSFPIYQVLSQKIKKLKALELSNEYIASQLKINRKTVAKGLDWSS